MLAYLTFYTFLAGCTVKWTEEENTNVFNSQINPATSVEDCKSACIISGSCNGVDWNPSYSASAGQRCWLSFPWSGHKNLGGAMGFTHYEMISNCTGKSMGLIDEIKNLRKAIHDIIVVDKFKVNRAQFLL